MRSVEADCPASCTANAANFKGRGLFGATVGFFWNAYGRGVLPLSRCCTATWESPCHGPGKKLTVVPQV